MFTCPRCGADVHPGDAFCGQCGLALFSPQEAAPLDSPKGRSSASKPPAGEIGTQRDSTEGERKLVTVLFSDLSGYTALAEKLDPEEVKQITSRVFAGVARVVSRHEGFVEKYIGDAVVALFGVPRSHEDDHLRALRAACEIRESVAALSTGYEEKIGAHLAFHTGITTGLVVTGEVNLEKGAYGLAGETLNLASRLCAIAKPGEILVGESTSLKSAGAFSFERLDAVFVKGRTEPVIPYRLLGEKKEPSRGFAGLGLSSPLVGRTAEIAALKGCVNRLLDGQGDILSLIGEAGLGKSRLLAEIRHAFSHEGLLWLEGRTLSYGQQMSYWPFREILWQLTGITEDDSETEAWNRLEKRIVDLFPAESGEILPYLAALIGLEVKGDLGRSLQRLDGEAMGKQIYLSSRRFFERLARSSPLVLVFEDLHWADESTVLLIEHLFPLVNRAPLLICGVSRPETGAPASRLRETALKDHERRYTEIRLGPLSLTECTDLMNNLLAIENLPSRTRQLILQKADGNPFFVEEIMRTLVDKDAVRRDPGGRWKATSQIETVAIPDTIQGVIMARIDRLDDELKQVLKAASVIGRAFLYRLLKEVAEAVWDLDRDLDDLVVTELIRKKQRVPELEYIFKHALVHESTYESILIKKRHELHGKVASAIETLFCERLDEFASVLAYHYAKAESWEKAQEYLFKAGDQAGRIAADSEALAHYQQAMGMYTRVFGDKWDPLQRGMLERKMGEAFYRRGETQKAMEYLQRALVCFGRPKLETSRWNVRLGILREIGVQLAYRLFSRSLLKKRYAPVGQAVGEAARIYEIVDAVDALAAPEHFLLTTLTYLNFAERTGHLPGIVSESSSLALISSFFSLFRLGRFFLQRAVVLAKQTQDPSALARLHLMLAISEDNAGKLDKAIEDGLKGIEIVRASGYWHLSVWGYLNHFVFFAYRFQGDIERSLTMAQEMVRLGQDANEPTIVAVGLFETGDIQERKGDFQECAAACTKAIELSEAIPMHLIRVLAGSFLGRCHCRMGDVERSLAILTQTDRYRAAHGVRGWDYYIATAFFLTYLTAAEQDAGPRRDEYLGKARRARARVFGWARGYRVCLPEATRLRGLYDWLTGRRSSAETCWRQSLVLAEEMGLRYDLGKAHMEIGRHLDDQAHLRQAEAIFAEIHAEFDLAETRRLLQPLAERNEA